MDKKEFNTFHEKDHHLRKQRDEMYKRFHQPKDTSFAFKDKLMKEYLQKIRKNKTTIKDSHWLRPENNKEN